jgi:hypothetical protein
LVNSKPSESNGRSALEAETQSESEGLIKLVSFQKTNGVEREFRGAKVYELEYIAEIEFLEDCIWGGDRAFGWGGSFHARRPDYFDRPPYLMRGARGNKGQRERVSGKLIFEETEKGWRLAE